MKNEIKYEFEICKECDGTGFIKTESCTCNDCEINNTCSGCNGKMKIKVVKSTSKNDIKINV